MKLSEIITNKGKGRGNLLVLWGGKCKKKNRLVGDEPVRKGVKKYKGEVTLRILDWGDVFLKSLTIIF